MILSMELWLDMGLNSKNKDFQGEIKPDDTEIEV